MDIDTIAKKLKDRRPKSMEEMARFAILIPLIEVNGSWDVIFELRSKDLKTQPGEVSFPGGRMEQGESYEETAIRETMEELNIERKNIRILGELDYLISYANMEIHCFLGTIDGIDPDDIVPNPEEVDHIFRIPLEFFLQVEPKGYHMDLKNVYNDEFPYNLIPDGKNYKFRKTRRVIYFYEYNDYIIWGYTASMIKHLVEVIKDI